MSVESVANELIGACEQLPRAKGDAEKRLIELRKSPFAVPAAQHVLANVANCFVQFQAAHLLRHAAVDQWAAMTVENRVALREQILAMAIGQATVMDKAVWMQLLYTVAILWKRGWFDDDFPGLAEGKNNLFAKIAALVQLSPNEPFSVNVLVGLNLLCALVDEFQFSSTKTTAIGMSFAYHRKCHESFELAGLRETFAFGSRLVAQLTEVPGALVSPGAVGVDILRCCLSLLERCLSWTFLSINNQARNRVFEAESSLGQSSEHVTLQFEEKVRPGIGWRDALLGERLLIETLQSLYLETRVWAVQSGINGEEEVPHLLRQLLLLLASLNGEIFVNDQQQVAYLERVLQVSLFGIVASPLAPIHVAAGLSQTFEGTGKASAENLAAAAGAEYLDLCLLFGRLVANFEPAKFILVPNFNLVIEKLVELSKGILDGAALCASSSSSQDTEIESSWLMEAFGYLLDLWVALSTWSVQSSPETTNPGEAQARDSMYQVSSFLFQYYVEKRLHIARVSIEKEDQENYQDEELFSDPTALQDHLSGIACVARVNATANVAFLTTVFTTYSEKLRQAMLSTPTQQSLEESGKLSEEMFWVVLLSAHVLADPMDGERPMIPSPILRLSKSFSDGNNLSSTNATADLCMRDPVAQLSWCLLRFLEFISEGINASGGADERISPLLAEKVLVALSRWSASYLLPELGAYSFRKSTKIHQGLPVSIHVCFGPNDQGSQIIDFLVKSSTVFLLTWGTETGVCTAALGLLRAIVENAAPKKILTQSSSWEQLCQAFVCAAQDQSWAPLSGLTSESQGALFEILLRSLDVHRDAPTKQKEYSEHNFEQLARPVATRLQRSLARLEQSADTLRTFSDPKWVHDFNRLLGMYLGASKAADCGPLAFWCRGLILESFGTVWIKLATASIVFLRKVGINTNSSSAATARHVVRSVLRLIATVTCDQMQITVQAQLPPFWSACDSIVQIFKEYYTLLSGSNSSGVFEEEDWANDVLLLLRILLFISQRDSLDWSDDDPSDPNSSTASGEACIVVMKGVALVFPCISNDLLTFPGLAEQLFLLLTSLVHTYPNQIASLNADIFRPIVTAFSFGILDHRENVSKNSLEALYELAQFHFRAVNGSPPSPGLGSNLFVLGSGSPSVFLHLLQQVFTFVVFQSFPSGLLNPAANAILALILCEQQNYPTMVDQMINSQTDPEIRERLNHAFTNLTSRNSLQLSLDRANRVRFHENMLDFVNEVRGFMRTK